MIPEEGPIAPLLIAVLVLVLVGVGCACLVKPAPEPKPVPLQLTVTAPRTLTLPGKGPIRILEDVFDENGKRIDTVEIARWEMIGNQPVLRFRGQKVGLPPVVNAP